MSTHQVTRSLRVSVPADVFTQIEHYAHVLGVSTAGAARILIVFGIVGLEMAADRAEQGSVDTPPEAA